MFLLKKNPFFKKLSVFTKPIQFKKLVLLRAPYRYKLARLHLTINRYNILLSLKIFSKNNYSLASLLSTKNKIENFSLNLESLFLHQNKITYSYNVIEKNNFFLKNF